MADANAAYMRAVNERKFEDAVASYSAAADALVRKGMRVGANPLQSESGLVAFSRNERRVRALQVVLSAYGEQLPQTEAREA